MIGLRHLFATLLLLAGLIAAPPSARAAQSYDNCTGFIDTLPASIGTQGTWCLRHDVTTAITSGNAITINTNNVTIDCNDFKVGGLQAGTSSGAVGIHANGRLNATVRHCNVRGFQIGIDLENGGGHLVEDNRLDQNLYLGIFVLGDNNRIHRNAIYDTGGAPGINTTFGIYADADVIDNTVSGVFATGTDAFPRGIYMFGDGSEARGNLVRGLVVAGAGSAYGIYVSDSGTRVDGNHVTAAATTNGTGINGNGALVTFCGNNTIAKFTTSISTCQDAGGNVSH